MDEVCGHSKLRVDSYTDNFEWVWRCLECGEKVSDHFYNAREWRYSLVEDAVIRDFAKEVSLGKRPDM